MFKNMLHKIHLVKELLRNQTRPGDSIVRLWLQTRLNLKMVSVLLLIVSSEWSQRMMYKVVSHNNFCPKMWWVDVAKMHQNYFSGLFSYTCALQIPSISKTLQRCALSFNREINSHFCLLCHEPLKVCCSCIQDVLYLCQQMLGLNIRCITEQNSFVKAYNFIWIGSKVGIWFYLNRLKSAMIAKLDSWTKFYSTS